MSARWKTFAGERLLVSGTLNELTAFRIEFVVRVNISGLLPSEVGVLDCHSRILQRFLHLRSVEQTIAGHQAALRLT